MSATTGNFGSSIVIGNEKNKPDHLLVLVHGILARYVCFNFRSLENPGYVPNFWLRKFRS